MVISGIFVVNNLGGRLQEKINICILRLPFFEGGGYHLSRP